MNNETRELDPLLRILLIEHDEAEAAMIDHVLRKYMPGRAPVTLDVSWAKSTMSALDVLDQTSFDVVLLGGLPTTEGAPDDLCRSLMQAIQVPIVLLIRDRAENGLTAELIRAGVDYFLFKDEGLRQDHLLREIYHAIDRHQWKEKCSELMDSIRDYQRMRREMSGILEKIDVLNGILRRLDEIRIERDTDR
jgi:DNA-binding response OmpR family regulator